MNFGSGIMKWTFAHPYLTTALGIAAGILVREAMIHAANLTDHAIAKGYGLEVGYDTFKITPSTRTAQAEC